MSGRSRRRLVLPTGMCQVCGKSSPGKKWCDLHRPDPKYHSKKTEGFDSKKEYGRYCRLLLEEKMGLIKELRLQVTFPLVVQGVLVANYRADFVYERVSAPGILVVEDVKGCRTPTYKLKAKLFKALYGFAITEV